MAVDGDGVLFLFSTSPYVTCVLDDTGMRKEVLSRISPTPNHQPTIWLVLSLLLLQIFSKLVNFYNTL